MAKSAGQWDSRGEATEKSWARGETAGAPQMGQGLGWGLSMRIKGVSHAQLEIARGQHGGEVIPNAAGWGPVPGTRPEDN